MARAGWYLLGAGVVVLAAGAATYSFVLHPEQALLPVSAGVGTTPNCLNPMPRPYQPLILPALLAGKQAARRMLPRA